MLCVFVYLIDIHTCTFSFWMRILLHGFAAGPPSTVRSGMCSMSVVLAFHLQDIDFWRIQGTRCRIQQPLFGIARRKIDEGNAFFARFFFFSWCQLIYCRWNISCLRHRWYDWDQFNSSFFRLFARNAITIFTAVFVYCIIFNRICWRSDDLWGFLCHRKFVREKMWLVRDFTRSRQILLRQKLPKLSVFKYRDWAITICRTHQNSVAIMWPSYIR